MHFAAIPAPELRPDGETFRINALSTYNVFAAAEAHRMRRVVWASSETVLGLPFDRPPRLRARSTRPSSRGRRSSYSLSKLVGETMAGQFARRTGIGFVGLRISNIMEVEDYVLFPTYWDDARCGRGTCGATSTRAMSRRRPGSASRRTVQGSEIAIVAAAGHGHDAGRART